MTKIYTAISGQVLEGAAHLDQLESLVQGKSVYLLPAGATFDSSEAEALAAEQLAATEAAKPPPPAPPPPPDPKALKAAEIRALEAPLADEAARMTRQVTLQTALDWACKQAPNLTTEQVHAALMAQGTGYFKLYNLEQAVKAIRDRP